MKKILGIILLMLVMIASTGKASAQDVGGYFSLKTNIRLDVGFDIGVTFNDIFGVKAGMMSDIYHPHGDEAEVLKGYKEALGKKYRLSYTVGPMLKLADWLWLSAVVGYGEYGTYGYSTKREMYGVSGKIKGLEAGAQLRFVFDDCSVEIGYNTVPKGFSLKRPLHDVSLGVGINF